MIVSTIIIIVDTTIKIVDTTNKFFEAIFGTPNKKAYLNFSS